MLKVLPLLPILFWNTAIAFPAEIKFDQKTYQTWKICNYEERLDFKIKKDNGIAEEYLRIRLTELAAFVSARGDRIDTAFRLISPLIRVASGKVYCLRVKKRCSFDIPFSELSKEWNHIIWYDMYNEVIGKTSLNGMGKKSDSIDHFADTGLLALTGAEQARIVLGMDWPDFSANDFLEIHEVRFEEYQNQRFDFEEEGDLGWEITFNHKNQLAMGTSDGGANGSKHCHRVERKQPGNADTAFRLASPYIPVKPDSYYILSFEERHNYDFTHVTEGYCQILWYDAERNLIGKSDMGGLLRPHLQWFFWMKPFFRSPKGARLARVEFGNDWPDFKYGDFWEVDEVWLRGH